MRLLQITLALLLMLAVSNIHAAPFRYEMHYSGLPMASTYAPLDGKSVTGFIAFVNNNSRSTWNHNWDVLHTNLGTTTPNDFMEVSEFDFYFTDGINEYSPNTLSNYSIELNFGSHFPNLDTENISFIPGRARISLSIDDSVDPASKTRILQIGKPPFSNRIIQDQAIYYTSPTSIETASKKYSNDTYNPWSVSVVTPITILLDFENGLNRDVSVRRIENHKRNGEYIAIGQDGSGFWPPSFFPGKDDERKATIKEALSNIFLGSSIPVTILTEAPDYQPDITVSVAGVLPSYDHDGDSNTAEARLMGKAFDVLPGDRIGAGIDRFDLRKNGNVAVFVDSFEKPEHIAEVIAHEVAHGLGARHVNPSSNHGREVLDYHFGDGFSSFTDQPTPIVEPPLNDTHPPLLGHTHNPAYHILRYAGENKEDELHNLQPGTWDVSGKFRQISITINRLFGEASGLSAIFNGADNTSVVGLDAGITEVPLIDALHEGSTITFSVDSSDSFSLIASSSNQSVADIVLATGEVESPIVAIAASKLRDFEGSILYWDSKIDSYQEIGTFSGSVSIRQVPEPLSSALLSMALLYICLSRNRFQPDG